MATISTSTQSFPLNMPSGSYIDRDPNTGYLWAMIKATTANTFELFRSINGGTTWVTNASFVRANVQDHSGIWIDQLGWLHFAYRTYETGADRVFYRRANVESGTAVWGSEVALGTGTTGGAGGVYTGVDVMSDFSGSTMYTVVAVGTVSGSNIGLTLMGVSGSTSGGTPSYNNSIISNKRTWFHAGSGKITPSLDIEHYGDAKYGYPAHIWCSFGRTGIYEVKLPWNGHGWTGPTSDQLLTTVGTATDSVCARWDGSRWLTVVQNPDATSQVLLIERNRANSTTTTRTTPTHTTGVIRNCAVSWNSTSGDARVFAIGTSTAVLYYVDFIRATSSWSSWTQVIATAVIGTAGNQYSVRRGTAGDARYSVVTCHSTPTQIHTLQTLTFAPNTPTWATAGGGAYDTSVSLVLDWDFSDPDPTDVQSAYAVRRQIGAGAFAYWRASDSTWQVAEVQNTSGATTITVASWSTGPTEATHTYWVKVWDTSGPTASSYSDGWAVIPSAKSNPTIVLPTAASTISDDHVTITWTVAEQTAYRVLLNVTGGALLHDSGWVTSTDLLYLVPYVLDTGGNYTLSLTTRNLEGLDSNTLTRQFFVLFVAPASPTLVATPVTASGWISVAITNPAPSGAQPALSYQDLYRRPVGSYSTVLNDNPYFETNTTGWQASGLASIARDNAQAHEGTWSMKVTPAGAGPNAYGELTIATMPTILQDIPYVGSAWIRPTTANKPPTVWLHWWTAANVYISSSQASVTAVAGVWQFVTVVAMPPLTAGKVAVAAGVDGSPAVGDTCFCDEVKLTANDAGLGTRVATGLASGATFNDWRVPAQLAVEYRVFAVGINGTSAFSPWTA